MTKESVEEDKITLVNIYTPNMGALNVIMNGYRRRN